MPSVPAAPRVASLLPAATEIVCALGRADLLVGVSHECDFPPQVKTLPVLTKSSLDSGLPSAAIDRDVRGLVDRALSVYEVDVDALRLAAPDVIVTQDLCEVCAVSLGEVQRAVHAALDKDVRIVSLRPRRLADIWEDVRTVADALGASERAELVLESLQARVATLARRAKLARKPRVLTIEWLDPVMIGGLWMPELIELAGGVPLVTRAGEPAATLKELQLLELDPAPEVVVIKPCGFTLARSEMEIERIDALLARLSWPAALVGDVFLADGNAYFNRPGPRIVDSLEILAACMHGFDFQDLARVHAKSFVRLAQHGRVR